MMTMGQKIDILTKLGFSDKGDIFERKVFGYMATIIIDMSKSWDQPTIKANSDWSDFKLHACQSFEECLTQYDDMANHYETQYSQYKHDLKRGRYEADRTISPDTLLKSTEVK